jgi:hypothetical protein
VTLSSKIAKPESLQLRSAMHRLKNRGVISVADKKATPLSPENEAVLIRTLTGEYQPPQFGDEPTKIGNALGDDPTIFSRG